MDGLRELVAVLEPHVTELDAAEPRIRSLVEGTPLPNDKKERLAKALIELSRRVEEGGSEEAADSDGTEEHDDPLGKAEESSTAKAEPDRELTELTRNAQVSFELIRGFHDAAIAPRAPLLYGSLLVAAVAAFEALVAKVYAEHLFLHPGALDAEDKEFSLAELQHFGDISDARAASIARRVDSQMKLGLDDWSRWTSKTLKTSLDELAMDYPALKENFQRRHIIVHNAGRVSRQYLAMVELSGGQVPRVEQPLPVDSAYLAQALDELDVTGSLLTLVACHKWVPEEHALVATLANQFAYDLLISESWRAAAHMCARAREREGPQGPTLMLQVNEWIARKRQQGTESIKEEVSEWDVSALAKRFLLAKYALLDDLDEVFELLPELLESKEVVLANLASWPLLQEAREDPRAGPMLEELAA